MTEILGAIVATLAVIGVILNNRKMIACFYLWLFSNALSAGIHIHSHLWSLAVRDWIFLVLAIEGIYKWRKKDGR